LRALVPRAIALLPVALLVVQACTTPDPASDRACAHRQPPPPPNVTGRGGNDERVFAVSLVTFGTLSEDDAGGPLYKDLGFDLDDTCTGEGQGPSCLEPSAAIPHDHDGVDGIDNAYGEAWWGVLPDSMTPNAHSAELILRLRGYSDDPDDDQIEVCLYGGLGLAPRENGGKEPVWDGQDRWSILPDFLAPTGDGGSPNVNQPLFCDEGAYVNGGVLVARFAEALWPSGSALAPSVSTRVEDVMMAGHLVQVQVGGTWALRQVVGGLRIGLSETLGAASRLPSQDDPSQPVCASQTAYNKVKTVACAAADLASGPNPSSSPCDSISAGFVFDADEAQLGDIASPPDSPLHCDPKVPEVDTCGSL
jgi:hypothetical protein